jgi:hypothetical protein
MARRSRSFDGPCSKPSGEEGAQATLPTDLEAFQDYRKINHLAGILSTDLIKDIISASTSD